MTVLPDATTALWKSASAISPLDNTGLTIVSGTALVVLVNCGSSGASFPAGFAVTWDPTGANQALTQIPNTLIGDVTQNSVSALYGLLAPVSGNKTLRVSWSSGSHEMHSAAASFTGVDQTSVAVAFPNGNTQTGTGTATSVTITSAIGNMVIAMHAENVGNLQIPISGTTIAIDNGGPNNGVLGNYDNGATSVALTASISASGVWFSAGCDIKASSTAAGLSISTRNFKVDKFKTSLRSMGPNAGLFQVRAYPVVSAGQAPFVQTDWPLPGQNPRLDESFVSDRVRFMVQQPASFFNHYDLSVPQANPRPDEFYSFENVQFISRQPASLFNHYDWPNPKTYQPIDQFYSYNKTLPMAQQPASFFNHYDWPNPQPVQWYQSWTFSNVQFISQQPASLGRNYDWPNPPRVTWYQDWSQNLQQTTLKPSQNLPFNQYDWPNPRTYPRPDEFYTFSNITVISNQPASFFNNQDWPNPRQYPRPDEFYSFSNVGIISQQPASLYRNYDWPNPRTAPPIDQFWVQNLVAFLSNQPMPFNQFDWPNPRGYTPIDQTWYQNLVSFLSQANPQPFNQYDWPLPKTTAPIDQFWSQSLVQTLPPPPPPVQTIGGGHQWTEADVKRAAAQWLAVMRWYPGVKR